MRTLEFQFSENHRRSRNSSRFTIIFAFFSIMLLFCAKSAEAHDYYVFSSSQGTYTPLVGGKVLVADTNVDNNSFPADFGFNFPFAGKSFHNCYVGTNGGIIFNAASLPSSQFLNSYNNLIVPLGKDLLGWANNHDTIQYKITGTVPNRICTIEWKNWSIKYAKQDVCINFQLILHENGQIEFCYGNFNKLNYTVYAQVGFRGASQEIFYSRTTKSNWNATTAGTTVSTMLLADTCKPAEGLTFAFTPDKTIKVKFNTMDGREISEKSFEDALSVDYKTDTSNFYFRQISFGGDTTVTERYAYPTREGYYFAGWFFDSTYENEVKNIKADTTIYAKWENTKFHVAFNTRGGSSIDTIILTRYKTASGQNPGLITTFGKFYFHQYLYPGVWVNTDTILFPTRPGYTFAGWYLDSAYKHSAEFNLQNNYQSIDKDTVLYAKWSKSYKITFDSRGGSAVDSVFVSSYGVINTIFSKVLTASSGIYFTNYIYPGYYVNSDTIPYPTRPGYTFAGWFSDTEYLLDANTALIYSDNVFYAKWIDTIRVKINTMGGSEIPEFKLSDITYSSIITSVTGWFFRNFKYDGNKITSSDIIPYPTRSGYTFAGWYFDSEYKNKVEVTIENPVIKISSDTVLYAKWNPAYKITFDSRGGSEIASMELVQFNQNENYRPFMLTTPSGFYFMQNPYTGSNYIYDWISSDTIPFPTRAGFEFEGWYFDSTYWFPAENKYANGYPAFSQDTVLYAKWKDLSSVENTDGRGIFALTLDQRSEICLIRSLSGKYFDKIMLFDASGHSMEISNDYTSQKEIDISRLSCGKYFVEIRSGGKNYLLDFVITR